MGEALPQPVPGLWGFLSALDQLLHCSPGREGRWVSCSPRAAAGGCGAALQHGQECLGAAALGLGNIPPFPGRVQRLLLLP